MKKGQLLAGMLLSLALVGILALGAVLARQILLDRSASAADSSAAITPVKPQQPETTPEPDSAPEPTPEPVPEPEGYNAEETAYLQQTTAQAQRLAAGYDYDAALALLQTPEAQAFPELQALSTSLEQESQALVRWPDTTTVPHIFFHSLIVDPARAFDGDSDQNGYNLYMATITEFRAILQQMYDAGFVLVRIHDIARLQTLPDGSTRYVQGDILLPEGKKPFVLSQDDTNYYEYMVDGDGDGKADALGDGFATRLVATQEGGIACEYITADGETCTGAYDVAPILEEFVQEHPDFSYRGARAIIGVTGYEGVYGYRTNPKYQQSLGDEAFAAEIAGAKAVTQRLQELGYEIASHSFGHPAYGEISAGAVAADVSRWEEQVEPITGDTDIFLYPYGSDISGVSGYSGEKFEAMYAAGYRFFCNVDGGHEAWVQIHDSYVRQGRRNIDGYRMYHNPELLDDLFDATAVLDPARPLPVPDI